MHKLLELTPLYKLGRTIPMLHSMPSADEIQTQLETLEKSPESLKTESAQWLASLIDHTLLKPEATRAQLKRLCEEAMENKFRTVCVNPAHVEFCTGLLKGSSVKPIAVVGFPLGAGSTKAKVIEARDAISKGAAEIDMVIQVGLLKDRDLRSVFLDIRKVVLACEGVPVKVILETSLLSDEEKIIGCSLAKAAGAAFVKTSTGFSSGGATVEDVKLMRRTVGKDMGVKASGGVRSLADALRMVLAGANRLGTSSGVAIVGGKSSKDKDSGVY